jgi:hypothetical protein
VDGDELVWRGLFERHGQQRDGGSVLVRVVVATQNPHYVRSPCVAIAEEQAVGVCIGFRGSAE